MRGKNCMKLLAKQSTLKVTTRATMVVLANSKHCAKERSKKTVNLNDHDNIEKSDFNNFQEILLTLRMI